MASDFTNEFLCPPHRYTRAIYKGDPGTPSACRICISACTATPRNETCFFSTKKWNYEELIEKVLGA